MDLQKQIKPASAAPRSRPVQKGKEASPLLGGVPGGRPAQDVEQLPRVGIVVRLRFERLANFFIGPHWHTQCRPLPPGNWDTVITKSGTDVVASSTLQRLTPQDVCVRKFKRGER